MIKVRGGVVYDADKNILGEFANLVFVPSVFLLMQAPEKHGEVERAVEQYKKEKWTKANRVRSIINERIEKSNKEFVSLVGLGSFLGADVPSHVISKVVGEYEQMKILKYDNPMHRIL